MLTPKVRPQINNLPHSQPNQHAHSTESKPLNALIRALIRIPQLLLSAPEIIHLNHNLANNFFDATQFGFDGFELLAGLNGGPVFGVGADVNVEFDAAEWVDVAAFCRGISIV